MIDKMKVGNVENVTVVELGTGDVSVAYFGNKEDDRTGVLFKEGVNNWESGSTTDEIEPDVMVSFSSIKSIEVVEKHLNYAKLKLRQMLKLPIQQVDSADNFLKSKGVNHVSISTSGYEYNREGLSELMEEYFELKFNNILLKD